MKKKIKSVLAVVLSVVISLTALTGCWGRNEDKGFEIGFSGGTLIYEESYVYIAAKSEKSKFDDINNVAIDLYFGTLASDLAWWESSNGYTDERFVPVCVAIFTPPKGEVTLDKEDYKKSDGFYKEFSLEEFFSENFGMTSEKVIPWIGEFSHYKYTFSHCEQLEISKDIFYGKPTSELKDGSRQGSLFICIEIIFYDNDNKEYTFSENLTRRFYHDGILIGFRIYENDEVNIYQK